MTAAVSGVFALAVLACTASVFGLWAPRVPKPGPVIHIDKQGYVAGEMMNITGAGFSPFERIMLRIAHANGIAETGSGHEAWFVDAGPNGTFNAAWSLSTNDTAGTDFVLQAAGASGAQASASFSLRK